MDFINFGMVKSPWNWVTVLLMVLIAGIAIHLVFDFYSIAPAKGDGSNNAPPNA